MTIKSGKETQNRLGLSHRSCLEQARWESLAKLVANKHDKIVTKDGKYLIVHHCEQGTAIPLLCGSIG